MKILMTGAGGQIGSDLITALVAQGHTIVATDLKPRPSTAAVTWRGLDVVDPVAVDRVIGEEAPEVVYHLAAILSATGEKNPALAYAVNQTGTWNVLEACRTRGVRQLLFCSSIAVYGPGLPDPTPDDVALRPTTMYGVTKAAGEMLCEYYRAATASTAAACASPASSPPACPAAARPTTRCSCTSTASGSAATRPSAAPTPGSRSCTCPTACARSSSWPPPRASA
jgi:nucleoside-diphosphate-sugar epimerase